MPRRAAPLQAEREAYGHHKARAKHDGIAWAFTFESWHAMWIAAGGFGLRGKGAAELVMARHGDVGPYAPENVTIRSGSENGAEAFANTPYIERQNTIGRPGTGIAGGRGYWFDSSHPSKPWRARFRSRHLGRFTNEDQARAAYVKAATEYLTSAGKDIPETLKA